MAFGDSDCIVIKIYVSNCSVIYVRQFGGYAADMAGAFRYSFTGSAYVEAAALSVKDNLFVTGFLLGDGSDLPDI